MSVDEELLARQGNKDEEENNSTDDTAARLKALKKEAERSGNIDNSSPKSLRQAVMQEKRKKGVIAKAKEKLGEKVNAIRIATSQLLKAAWQNLLPTWGFSLLWIDIHVIASVIFGKKVFCPLGEEWTTGKSKKALKVLKLIEPMGVGLLNLGCLFIIIAISVVIGFIASALDEPFKTLFNIGGELLKDFMEIF